MHLLIVRVFVADHVGLLVLGLALVGHLMMVSPGLLFLLDLNYALEYIEVLILSRKNGEGSFTGRDRSCQLVLLCEQLLLILSLWARPLMILQHQCLPLLLPLDLQTLVVRCHKLSPASGSREV